MRDINATKIIRQKIPGMRFGLLECQKIKVVKDDNKFESAFSELQNFLSAKFPESRPSEDEIVGHVRRLYRRIGWEPTQYRPSSEALIRRVLQGKELYRINNLVDYGNLVSARFHLPMGLYDTAKIEGTIEIDVGRPGESYQGLSKEMIHAEGKLILRDSIGVFGNPTADSKRTSIEPDTTSALAVFFCPPEVPAGYIESTLQALQDFYLPFCSPENISRFILAIG